MSSLIFKRSLNNCYSHYKHFCKFYSTQRVPSNQDIVIEKLQDKHEGITVFGLNRPTVKNALSKSLVYELLQGLEEIKTDQTAKVLILQSKVPGIFCAGADLKERKSMSEEEVRIFVKGLREMMRRIENLPIPVIAALDGSTMGGGLEMALACDIRIAANTIKMGLVETKLAIIPGAGGTQRLPRIINPAIAKELIFTSRLVSGKEAKELGIVNHSVEQNETKNAAFVKSLQIAEEILPNGPIALKMAKQAISEGVQYDLSKGYEIEQSCYENVIKTEDRLEGLKAFAEKRTPKYKGK